MPRGVYARSVHPVKTCSVDGCGDGMLARTFCKKHYRRFMSYGDPLYRIPRDIVPAPDGMRVCSSCSETKSLELFNKTSRNPEGRTRVCKPCSYQKYSVPHYEKHKEVIRSNGRTRSISDKYGTVGLSLYEDIQAGAPCEACGEIRTRMAIDHNHTTGEIRGILCSNCNTALGLLAESPERFTSLLSYLIAHSEETSRAQ